MEKKIIIINTIFLVLILAVIIYGYFEYKKVPKEIEEIEELICKLIRNKKVAIYRSDLLNRLSSDDYENLPTYDEMLNSDKELIDSNWLNNK